MKSNQTAKKIRLGFIGIGAMGLSHLRAFGERHAGEAEIAAFCSAGNRDRLEQAQALAPGVVVFTRPDELIASALDAVVVAAPNDLHAPLALETLRAGKDLFLEKPAGISRAQCAQLLQAAQASDRVTMLGHELRYSPFFQKIKELVDAGEIGAPRLAWTREFRGPFQKKSGDWIEDAARSGGTLVDKNCHHFDLMNWWIQSAPRRVCAFGGCAVNRVLPGPRQGLDHAVVSFEYENGARGALQLCLFARDFPEEELEMGVVGDRGVLQTRLAQLEILQWRRGRAGAPVVHKPPSLPGEGWGRHLGFLEIHQAFLDAVRTRREPLTSARNCLAGTLLAIAAEESIRTGQAVDVEPAAGYCAPP